MSTESSNTVVGVALRESAGRDARQTKKSGWALLRSLPLSDAGPVATLIALVAVFAASSPQFLTIENAQAILESSAIPIVLVVGVTFILIQGSFDLSIEGVMAASRVPSRRWLELGWRSLRVAQPK